VSVIVAIFSAPVQVTRNNELSGATDAFSLSSVGVSNYSNT